MAFDLSSEMLARAARGFGATRATGAAAPHLVRGDLEFPPFGPGAFGLVALLGNSLGFAGARGDRLLQQVAELTTPSGRLLVEIAPSAGERSIYLGRLPATAVGRLFESPVALLTERVLREGFRDEPRRHEERGFHRWSVPTLDRALHPLGWEVDQAWAVAPALGPDAERLARIQRSPKGWSHLLELEERIGGRPDRWPAAASVLVAARSRARAP